jgi:GTPase SAR1 family protein
LRGEQVKVHFFDAERGADFGDLRLKSAHVVIACYDVSDRLSFYNLDRVKSAIERNSNQNVKVFLVANKIDLANRVISSEEGRARATELGFDGYFETSAKTGRGCEEVVLAAAELLVAPAPSSGARGPR